MSTRLLLEGPDIETLLSRVHAEHGPRARIVAADKVRSGGIAGFFARERFEVQVEIDEPQPYGAPAAVSPFVSPSDQVAVSPASLPSRPDPELGTPAPDGPASLLELAAAVDEVERAMAPMAPVAIPAALVSGPVPTVSTASPDFADLLGRLVAGADGPAQPQVPSPVGAMMAFQPAVSAPVVSAQVVVPPVEVASCPRVWHRLGLPEPLCATAPSNPRDLAGLIDALAALPSAPRLRRSAGDVVVVMGEGLAGLDVARLVARRLRSDPDAVLLAASGALAATVPTARRIGGPVEARRKAGALHRASTPVVVAIDAPIDEDGPEWACEVADALDAVTAWAVVDATHKTGDLAEQLDRLGRIDALAVRHAHRSADPASVLALGRPVALLDGAPATARAWAMLLHEKASGA